MKYDIFLIDADNTLFDYDAAEACALRETFAAFNLPFGAEIEARYRQINKKFWALFDEGKVTKDVLVTQRFIDLFDEFKINCDCTAVSKEYVFALGRGAQLIDGAFDVCKTLYENKKKIYIVTNGVAVTQKSRLALSSIKPFVDGIFVSEDAGFQKPDKRYFDYVLSCIGNIRGKNILMVGDTLRTDILGGINAGFDTCLFDPIRKQGDGIKPTYEISELTNLLKFI